MSVRLFLVLAIACAAAGYTAGLLVTRWRVDAHAPPSWDPRDARIARAELAATRSIQEPTPRAQARRAFLARWPASWLRAHWLGEGPR